MLAHVIALALLAARPDAVVARVGSDTIMAGEVLARAHELHVRPSLALDDLIREALIATEARAEGLANDPALRARLAQEQRRVAMRVLIDREIVSRVRVKDAEVAAAFHAQRDEIRISVVVRATEQEARGVLDRLRAGAGIIQEARSSIDPVGRARSGVMGWYRRNQLPHAFAQAAFAAPLGQPAGPVAYEKGHAVFIVHERRVGTTAELNRDAPALRAQLENTRREALAARMVRALRARTAVKVDVPFLASTGSGIAASPETASRVVAVERTRKVTYAEVLERIRNEAQGRGLLRREISPQAKEAMAWRILDEDLLEREALRRHLTTRTEARRELHRATRAILAQWYERRMSDGLPAPTEHEIERQYEVRGSDFWVPAHRTCTILDAPDGAGAQSMCSRLTANEPVERVVADYPEPRGSDHPIEPIQFTDTQLDAMSSKEEDQHALAWTIRQSTPGKWITVESRGHWHVITCQARRPARRRALAEVREEIAAGLRDQGAREAIDARISVLRRSTPIRVHAQAITGG